ncbi:hypothetical protein U4W13_22845, partial [Escherichia coli]
MSGNIGANPEDARLNTSSVALVTSGLERLSNLLSKKDSVFVSDLLREAGNDSNLLIVFYVQIMPDDFVMQLHR